MDGCILLRQGGSNDNLPFKIHVCTHTRAHIYTYAHIHTRTNTRTQMDLKLTKTAL